MQRVWDSTLTRVRTQQPPTLQVVYAMLEPLVHTYVRDLRMPENGYTGSLQRVQEVLVFVRVLTKENAEVCHTAAVRCCRFSVALILCDFVEHTSIVPVGASAGYLVEHASIVPVCAGCRSRAY